MIIFLIHHKGINSYKINKLKYITDVKVIEEFNSNYLTPVDKSEYSRSNLDVLP